MSEEPTRTEGSSPAWAGEKARQLILRAKRATRPKFPAEEKIRIVLEGVRAEESVAGLCRRQGIRPTIYYKWLKDFREAGKNRLRGDTQREATSEEVQQAVEWTGMEQMPVEDRTRLVSDNGSGYLARAFEDYLGMLAIWHIRCSPHHAQTTGKIERFHETLTVRMNLLVYTSPDNLRAAMAEFIEFYNHRRYHVGIGNVTPADVYPGRREEILRRREEQKQRTVLRRIEYNLGRRQTQTTGELGPETVA